MSVHVDGSIGVAIVGLGVGEEHAVTYKSDSRCRVLKLFDSKRDRAMSVAEKLGVGAIAESYEEIVGDSDVDVVSIASYDDAHFSQVVAALNAGKHVFVEKPLCQSVEELREIKMAWMKHDGRRKLFSNLVLRAASVYQWLKREIQQGRFGDIYGIDGDYLYGRFHKITDGWRGSVEDYSVMKGGGIHLIDLMLWLTGQRPDSVTCVGNRLCSRGKAFRYDDFMAATFRFSSGLIGRITANFGCVHRHQHVLRLFGSKATFLLDDAGPRIFHSRAEDATALPLKMSTLPRNKGELIPAFIDAVYSDVDARTHTQECFDAISISAAAEQALKTKSEVEVCYL